MKETNALTIIVPVYNESENIHRLSSELKAYVAKASVKTKVLFINDGSTDDSLLHLRQVCGENQTLNYLNFDKNYGLSAAIKAGFDHVETSLTGYIDADLQTSPLDFELLLPHISKHDLVTGVRVNRQDSFVKSMSSKIANGIRRAFTRDGMDDSGCPLKILKTSYAKRIPMFRGLHRFLPAMVLLQNGTVKQVPVQHFERTAGTSSFGLWDRLLGPLADCFAYLWMKRKYINYNIKSKG